MNPYCKSYLKQAKINEDLANYIKSNCPDKIYLKWVFVIVFYSALHYFHAFLIQKQKPLPVRHTKKNDYDIGAVELAINEFYSEIDGRAHSAGADYEQLFKWSLDIRYHPDRWDLIGTEELDIAFGYLEGIKFVTFNETGNRPKWKKQSKDYFFESVKPSYLFQLIEYYKKFIKP